MPRELIQARADPDTVDGIEEYAEERGISRSEAIRRLLREGLEVQEEDDDEPEEYAVAKISPTVRIVGGAMLGLVVLFLLLSELGLL